jgi:UDPglucose 6-dehydrogenase
VLPPALQGTIELARDPLAAANGADALVVGTEWPSFREVGSDAIAAALAHPVVVDPGRFLQATIATDTRIRYVSVGTPQP